MFLPIKRHASLHLKPRTDACQRIEKETERKVEKKKEKKKKKKTRVKSKVATDESLCVYLQDCHHNSVFII